MTEQQKDNEPLQSEVLRYLGKELKKEGKTEEGREWKVFGLNFQSGKQYPHRFSTFDKLSDKNGGIQPKDLEEGKWYKIVYKTTTFQSQYGEKQGKQAVVIYPAEEKDSTEGKTGQQGVKMNAESGTPGRLVSKDWVNFAKEYDELMKDRTDKNALHMLGAWVKNYYKDEAGDLITLCLKHFEAAKPKEPLQV